MKPPDRPIGFDRDIELRWLDAVAAAVASGAAPEEARSILWASLATELPSARSRGARDKTITVLLRVWSTVPAHSRALRDQAVAVLPTLTPPDRLALHWALMAAAYPVFLDVASTVGRLAALHGTVTLDQVTRRMTETWGDRSTLVRAARRVVRSMVRWGVLNDLPQKGTYELAPKLPTVSETVGPLLAEGLLIGAGGQATPLAHLATHPALFPFRLDLTARTLRDSPRLEVHRQGLDTDIVELRAQQSVAGP